MFQDVLLHHVFTIVPEEDAVCIDVGADLQFGLIQGTALESSTVSTAIDCTVDNSRFGCCSHQTH